MPCASWLSRRRHAGLRILLEPLNSLENPDYLLATPQVAAELIERCDSEALGMLLDVYHVARVGADPLVAVERYAELIGHVQISDFPGRGQPGSGSLELCRASSRRSRTAGYEGSIGLEYVPSGAEAEPMAFLNDARSPVRL